MKNAVIKAMLFLAAVIAFAQVQPAWAATGSDPAIMSRLQIQRNDLLVRETKLLRDKDELNRQIDDVKKRDDANATYVLNDLAAKLDSKFYELQLVRMDIRDVERRMM